MALKICPGMYGNGQRPGLLGMSESYGEDPGNPNLPRLDVLAGVATLPPNGLAMSDFGAQDDGRKLEVINERKRGKTSSTHGNTG